jgi:CheY-like chemotaxis protein
LRVAQDPDHPSRVRFVVADTGPGLSDKQVEYLRSPFRQLTNPWPQAQKGLGFVLIKKILSDLGGTLQIESKKGSGTTLSFLLPESSLQKSQAVAAPLNANNSHLTVLVAGDELISRQVVNGLLKKVGVVPTISRCGRPAVDFYHQAPFDVVFVDLDSPSGAGLMTVAAIRDHAVTLGSKRTHLIGLTSNERSPDLQQLHEAGVTEVLSKPVSLNQIREVLARRGFTPTTHSSLTRPAPSEDALNNLVMLDVEREKRRVKRPASGSYYINFDRLYNSLDENMVLCADMLRQVSRELELDLDRLATAMKDKNRADIKMILNKLYGELTMIRCEAGIKAVQNAEAAAALTGDEAFQNSFEEMSELFEKILAEIDSLVPAEQIAG